VDVYREQIRQGFDRERLTKFLSESSQVFDFAKRTGELLGEAAPTIQAWSDNEKSDSERGVLLRSALGRLGPVFTKIGQTLAERPDLLPKATCDELRKLQVKNTPFADEEAFRIIVDDLAHDGPLYPGGYMAPGADTEARPLFQAFGPRVGSASLGQVYRAQTWEGQDVAVKVQRANVSKQVILDWKCIKTALDVTNAVLKNSDDISLIADTAIQGIMEELDYHKEATSALLFLDHHRDKPWITAPRFLLNYTGPKGSARVLTMEWIEGRRVGQIEDKHEQLHFVNMAVEACVSQLVCTGFVHIDPHEGNILLTDDGRIAFLDFGLMGHVPPSVMEGFAAGIQHTLAGDYISLAEVMQDVDFIPKEGFQRVHGNALDPGNYYFTPTTKEDFAENLDAIMSEQEGGKSQFGGLFVGLLKMSNNFRLKTPPYIILFVRTFLTLEGIAAQYDPNFNIYEVGMPFALRRALAPVTESAKHAFRDNLLTASNKLHWDTLLELMEQTNNKGTSNKSATGDTDDSVGGFAATLARLLSAPEGRTVRGVLADVDLSHVARVANLPKARPLRRRAAKVLRDSLVKFQRQLPEHTKAGHDPLANASVANDVEGDFEVASSVAPWRVQLAEQELRDRERRRRVLRGLADRHVQRLRRRPLATALLLLLALRVMVRATAGLAVDSLLRRMRWRNIPK